MYLYKAGKNKCLEKSFGKVFDTLCMSAVLLKGKG